MQIFFKRTLPYIPLLIAVGFFLSFGLYHIAKFETTDEHFWKYDRIAKYYSGIHKGISENDWRKTRINDKPGVTVALTSGIGLLFGPQPDEHLDVEAEEQNLFYDEKRNKDVKLYDLFHAEVTEQFNLALRIPILLFNALVILPLLFFLIYQITRNFFIAGTSILLIGLSPTLIGISQIINPDSLLWGTAAVALLGFVALTETNKKYLIILVGVATGFALLSKYTATLLFLIYPLVFFLTAVLRDREIPFKETIITYAKHFLLSTLVAFITFALLLPAVFHKPAHFLYGTLYSPPFQPLVDAALDATNMRSAIFFSETDYATLPMLIFSGSVFLFLTIILPSLAVWLFRKKPVIIEIFFKIMITVMLLLFVFSLFNAWTHESIIPLNDLKETSRVGDEMVFPQFADNSTPLFYAKALLTQSQNLIFPLTPITLLLVLTLWTLLLLQRLRYKNFIPIIYAFAAFPFIFFIGGLFADIFVNIRYGIMLFVPYAFLAALGLHELMSYVKESKRSLFYGLALVIIVIMQSITLFQAAPHYFTYLNFFLPKQYSTTDTWGYGNYEAAQYINGLDQADQLVVWTDHRGLCQFITGKCIVSNEINLDHTDLDYLVYTRRGMLTQPLKIIGTHQQSLINTDVRDPQFVQENTVHEIHINNRPSNFIRIVKVQ